MLHRGHIRLLERAKALGDYLIVGVTADDFDKTRGKINVQQSLMERIDGVKSTGLADEIIVEEYEGQKIDDIKKYDVDIFTVGSDWKGKFDYLNEYCKVVYLERTQGVSSTEIREQKRQLRMGLVGESKYLCKLLKESTSRTIQSTIFFRKFLPNHLHPINLCPDIVAPSAGGRLFASCSSTYISKRGFGVVPLLHRSVWRGRTFLRGADLSAERGRLRVYRLPESVQPFYIR